MHKKIEELTLNHWPSLQTVLYDGWILRFAEGYTKRANSVNPIYPSNIEADIKITECERLYSKRNLPTVFKISPFAHPSDLDSILEQKGYDLVEPSLVKTMDLSCLKKPCLQNVKIDMEASGDWIEDHCRFSGKSLQTYQTLSKIIANIAAPKAFISLLDGNKVVSSGFGVIEHNYIGLYNVVTEKENRNKGYGEQLLLNLLNWAKMNGAAHSYLQVLAANEPAVKLYSKLGFQVAYGYWYRVKQAHRGDC